MTDVFLNKLKMIKQKYGIQETNHTRHQQYQCPQNQTIKQQPEKQYHYQPSQFHHQQSRQSRIKLYEQQLGKIKYPHQERRSKNATQILNKQFTADNFHNNLNDKILKVRQVNPLYRDHQYNQRKNSIYFDSRTDFREHSHRKNSLYDPLPRNKQNLSNTIQPKCNQVGRIRNSSVDNMNRIQKNIYQKIQITNKQGQRIDIPQIKNIPFSYTGTCFENKSNWDIRQLTRVQDKIQAYLRK